MKNAEIGNRLKNLRINSDMSREQLAERAGVSAKFVYDIERGVKGMSAETLGRLAKALGQTCDFLIRGVGDETDSRQKVMNIIEQYDDRQITALLHLLQAVEDIHMQDSGRKE